MSTSPRSGAGRAGALAVALAALAALFAPATAQEAAPGTPGAATPGQASAAATPRTSAEVVALRGQVEAQKKGLVPELAAARAAVPTSAAEEVAGIRAEALRVVQALERLDLVHQQQLRALRETADLQAMRAGVEARLSELARVGPPGKPPWSLLVLDRLSDELDSELGRLDGIRSEVEAARDLHEQALATRDERVRTLASVRELHAQSKDPSNLKLLAARVAGVEAEVRLAGEMVRLRELELAVELGTEELQQQRIQLLRDQVGWVQKEVQLRPEDLDEQQARLERERAETTRQRDQAQVELVAAEARWARVRQRLDLSGGEPDPVLVEEVKARQQEVLVRQREVALAAARLDRIAASKQVWTWRAALIGGSAKREDARGYDKLLREYRDRLDRDEKLQTARIAELRKDLATLSGEAADPGAGNRAKWLAERAKHLGRLVQVVEADLTSMEAARRLYRKVAREIARRAGPGGFLGRIWLQLQDKAEEYWEAHLERLLWPALRILALLFLGVPMLWLASGRAQATMGRFYGGQAGMIAGKAVFWLGLTVVLVSLLNELGVGLAPLLGAAGVTGVALGFASQTSVSNMISGLFLIAENPFAVDDVIVVEGVTGTVLSVDLLSIKIRTFDNRFVRIPNETILKTNVTNLSRYPIRRVDLVVSISFKDDIDRVRGLLLDLAQRNPKGLVHPAPVVMCQGFSPNGIELQFSVWCAKADVVELRAALMTDIQKLFRKERIQIPFPQVAVHAGWGSRPIELKLADPGPASKRPAPPGPEEDAAARAVRAQLEGGD